MLKINEYLAKTEKIMVKIEPTIKNEDGEWIANKNYKLELLSGEVKKMKTQDGKAFEKVAYTCNIINDDGSKSQGIYEVAKTNQSGELNYIIKKMIEIELDAGDIFFLGTDDKGFITINKLGKGSGEELETIDSDEIPTEEYGEEVSQEELDSLKDLPF